MQGEWQSVSSAPERVIVRTKVDDKYGYRNDQELQRIGRLWFDPDGSMYVNYTPTHWMELPPSEADKREER